MALYIGMLIFSGKYGHPCTLLLHLLIYCPKNKADFHVYTGKVSWSGNFPGMLGK
jgi:hypothetical protein